MRVEICVGRMASYPVQPQNLKNIKICKKKKEENTELHKQPKRSTKVCELDNGRGGRGACAKCQILFFQNNTTTNTHFPLGGCDVRVVKVCRKKCLRSSFILKIFSLNHFD